jgi:hypothetical protein
MGKSTSLGTLIALGKIARTTFAFFVLCTVDGRRESGARMELTLRIVDDRVGGGDEEREGGRGRWEAPVADAALSTAVLSTSTGLTAR